jgi:hypothetical protein
MEHRHRQRPAIGQSVKSPQTTRPVDQIFCVLTQSHAYNSHPLPGFMTLGLLPSSDGDI